MSLTTLDLLFNPMTTRPCGGRFSNATIEHVLLSFEESHREFVDVTTAFKNGPSFPLAVDVSLASRTVWLKAVPEWRVAGDSIAPAMAELRDHLAQASELLKKFGGSLTGDQKQKLSQFCSNINWRCRMAAVLADTSRPIEERQSELIKLEVDHGKEAQSRSIPTPT